MKLYQNLVKLKDYRPKTRGCTNMDEIRMIRETLDLENSSDDDLQNYRDMCVMLWDYLYTDAIERMDPLQSITSVIDMEKLKRGMEV